MPALSTQPNRAYPNIPEITEEVATHTVALRAIKDALQTHERRDNNFLKSFVRFEEMIDLGIIDVNGQFVLDQPSVDSDGDPVDDPPSISPVTLSVLNDLLDVTVPTPINNNILGFDSSSSLWINQTPAELGISVVGHTHPLDGDLGDLNDVNLAGAHDFDMLYRVGGLWVHTDELLQWDGSDLHLATGDFRFYPVGGTATSAIRPNLPNLGDLMIQNLTGDLFLQPVGDVVLDGITNLVVESSQSIRWFDEADRKRTMLRFAPEAGGTGAAVGHIISKLVSGVTTTSGTYADVTGALVAFASMEANENYAVFVRAYIGNSTSTTTAQNKVRLTKGGTLVSGSEEVYESPSTTIDDVGMLYCWGGIINAGASGDLQLQHESGNGSDTVFANNVTIMMIKIDDLILNTNIFHDTDTGLVELDDGSFPAAWIATNADVTVGGTGDYLVFGSVRITDFQIGGNQVGIRVNDGSTTKSGSEVGRADNSDQHTMGFMQLWQGVAASTTLAVEAQTTGFPVDKVYASIIAIRLDAFADYNSDFLATSPNLGFGPLDLATVAFTTSSAGDYGFISGATGPHNGNQGSPNFIRNDLNGGGDVTIGGSETQFGFANIIVGTTDNVHWGVSADQSLSAGDTVDADLHALDANSPNVWTNCFLVAFQWNLTASEEFFNVGNINFVTRNIGKSTRFYDPGLTDYVEFDHDDIDFNITGFQTANINITGITSIQAGTVDADFDALSITNIQFDLADVTVPDEGLLKWNDESGTLEVGLPGGGHSLQIGQEIVLRVRNTTGSEIVNGSVVRAVGSQGNRVLIALADATDSSTSHLIGVATEDIGNNSNGFICVVGLVIEVDTSGMDEGDTVWLSETAGEFTNIKPTPPAQAVHVGHVVQVSANNGSIIVSLDDASELVELGDIDTAAQTANFFLATPDGSPGNYSGRVIVDGDVAESIVTQHEVALTILESQITDGAILNRIGENEVITGTREYQGDIGFYSTTPIAQQTAVPVTIGAVHAALVSLGLITA